MRTNILLLFVLFYLYDCSKEDTITKDCFTSKVMSIQFNQPFNFSKLDTLTIDNIKYTHSYAIDSINRNNVLPKEKIVLLQKEGKEATTKTNAISIGRILATKLKSTGKYEIINIPEVITSGVIKFKRVDENAIKICATKNYLAKLKGL